MPRKARKSSRQLIPDRKSTGSVSPVRRLGLPRRRWLTPVILALIVIAGFALRASDLSADPPPDLSWSFAPYTDEGLNTYSARSLILNGNWQTDDFFPFVVYPLFNILVALAFRLFGVGFITVKLVSVLAGLSSIVALYFLVRDSAGPLAGLISALLMAVSYPLVMYTRLGLVESLQILFLLLAGLCWTKGRTRAWAVLLSGLFAAGTILLVKISALFIAPVMLVLLVLLFVESRRDSTMRAGRDIGLFFCGVGAAALVWLLAVFLPHRAEYLQYVLRHSFESPAGHPGTIPGYLFNTFTVGFRSQLLPRAAFAGGLGFLLLPGLGISRRDGFRYLLAWFVFGLLMLGYMNYRPPRYEIVILPPLIAAAGTGLARLIEQGTFLPASRTGRLRRLGWSLWLWPLATWLLARTGGFWGLFRPESETAALGIGLGTALLLAAVSLGATRLLRAGLTVRPPVGRLALAGLFLLLSFRLDLAQFSRWHHNRTHDMVRYSRQLDAVLPDRAVLAGSWAPALLMESKKRALCLTDWANLDDPVGRHGMTHLVSHEENDILLLEPTYPELRRFLRPVWQGTVRGTRLTAFALVNPEE